MVVALGALFILIFAGLDEAFQSNIPGRHQDLWDLTADFVGGVIVLIALGVRTARARSTTEPV